MAKKVRYRKVNFRTLVKAADKQSNQPIAVYCFSSGRRKYENQRKVYK
jgi:hypothetical protein